MEASSKYLIMLIICTTLFIALCTTICLSLYVDPAVLYLDLSRREFIAFNVIFLVYLTYIIYLIKDSFEDVRDATRWIQAIKIENEWLDCLEEIWEKDKKKSRGKPQKDDKKKNKEVFSVA